MIKARNFVGFIDEIIRISNREQTEKVRWELYLHQISNFEFAEAYPTFGDYVKAMEFEEQRRNKSDKDIGAVINNSYQMINNFVPEDNAQVDFE